MRTAFVFIFMIVITSTQIHAQPAVNDFSFTNLKFGDNHEAIRERLFFKLGQRGTLWRRDDANHYYLKYDDIELYKQKVTVQVDFLEDQLTSIQIKYPERTVNELTQAIGEYKTVLEQFSGYFEKKITDSSGQQDYTYLINHAGNCEEIINSRMQLPAIRYYISNAKDFIDGAVISLTYVGNKNTTELGYTCKFFTSIYLANDEISSRLDKPDGRPMKFSEVK